MINPGLISTFTWTLVSIFSFLYYEYKYRYYLRITALLECIIGIYKHEFTNKKQEI